MYYNENLYHGTSAEAVGDIIKEKNMKSSLGEKHWLGDGVYFFEEDFYAFKWILDSYSNQEKIKFNENNFINNFSILEGEIKTKKIRVFDLTKMEFKTIFDMIYTKIKDKKEGYEKLKKHKVSEGVVLNYIFNILEYDKEFDLVIAMFTLNKKNYTGTHMKLGYMPQKQICVKNKEAIKEIRSFNYKPHIDKYLKFVKSFYFDNYNFNNKYYKKVKNVKKYYYKSDYRV